MTSISTVFESCLKRSQQIKFLQKIDQIDAILNTNLLIYSKYKHQQKRNFLKLIAWFVMFLLLQISVVVATIIADMKAFLVYWTLYTIPLFVCMMRYQQFIAYVNLVYDRFVAINECIVHLTASDSENSNHMKKSVTKYSAPDRKPNWHRLSDFKTLLVMKKLKHLQWAHRLIVEVNKNLCHLFSWPMLLNVSKDFLNVLINSYWVVLNIIEDDSKLELIGILSWSFFVSQYFFWFRKPAISRVTRYEQWFFKKT